MNQAEIVRSSSFYSSIILVFSEKDSSDNLDGITPNDNIGPGWGKEK